MPDGLLILKTLRPIVGISKATHLKETLPAGATIELQDAPQDRRRALILWNGSTLTVFREDLMDACEVRDVWKIDR
jgi:hypothetical protein